MNLETSRQMLAYNDWADAQVLAAAAPLSSAQLDQPFEIGRGSLRRTLLHVYGGEHVWLQRSMGQSETPWVDEDEAVDVQTIRSRFEAMWRERDAFLRTLSDADLSRPQVYRDSRGSRFQATLGEMLLQMYLHSTHHRAQIVNMLRRLGTDPLELDYMCWVRKPAG